MSKTPQAALMIRSATTQDVPALLKLRLGTDLAPGNSPSADELSRSLHAGVRDQTLLVASTESKVHACAGIDLTQPRLSVWLSQSRKPEPVAADRLLEACERLAASFGILDFSILATPALLPWLEAHGYSLAAGNPTSSKSGTALLKKSLRRLQTRYGRRVTAISRELGIPKNYGQQHKITLQEEAGRLSSIGPDVYGREQRLMPRAARAWIELRHAATKSGIEIQPVSAWRSVEYQQGLLRRKLDKGQAIDEILRVSAAPGYSEHHTGRAIDITTPGFAVLEEEFERSAAFSWMKKYAAEFGFQLSFPRRNRHKLTYEPWHWCYKKD